MESGQGEQGSGPVATSLKIRGGPSPGRRAVLLSSVRCVLSFHSCPGLGVHCTAAVLFGVGNWMVGLDSLVLCTGKCNV